MAGGLASRRQFQLRPSSTSGAAKPLSVTTTRDKDQAHIRCLGIKQAKFIDEYDIGKEVMPSCHKGMQVMHAKHRATGQEVVVKIRWKKESFRSRNEESEWRENSEYMLNLPSCANIAKLFEVIEDDKAYYVIMEKVEGKDLFESIAGQDLLPLDDVKEIVAQILAALAELHGRGRIHKDLKLENVMLDRTPTSGKRGATNFEATLSPKSPLVKLIDFDTLEEFVPATPKKTKDVLGTDQYIAQEAYDGNYSPASDIFAAGVIAYRLCTGKFPFKSDMFDDKPGENWVGSPKMKEIRTKLKNFKIRWSYKAFEAEPAACDLIQSMLAVAECDRPSAAKALSHPWLTNTVSAQAYRNGDLSSKAPGPAARPWHSETAATGAAFGPRLSSGRGEATGARRFLTAFASSSG